MPRSPEHRHVPRPPRRHEPLGVLLAGALTPALFAAYLVLVGDPYLPEPFGRFPASAMLWVFYVVPLGTLGAAVIGFGPRLRVSAGLALLALLGLPWYAPSAPDGSLFAVNFPALFALIVVLVVASAEWIVRNPNRARGLFTRRATRVGLAVGVAHAILAHLLRTGVFGYGIAGPSLVSLGIALWMTVGAIFLGATPSFLYARFRLVTPTLLVAGLFVWTAWDTWQHVLALRESGAASALAFTPFTGYLVAWFVGVALAIGFGWLEQQLRQIG